MTTLAPERCAFCGGSIVTERDEDGLARKCMSCSRETRLIESPRTQTDWQTMAKNRLAEVVRQVAAADPLKREAELIVAALTAAGVQAPELPWKARKSGGGGAPRTVQEARPRTYPACVTCGRQFTAGPQYQRQPDGSAICREGCGAA